MSKLSRYSIFPIQYDDIWRYYKLALASFWDPAEIVLSKDKADWVKLTPQEQRFIKNTLGFFANSDTIVNENLCLRFINEIDILEAKCFYGFQIAMENIHSETYALLIDTYIDTPEEKAHLFNAIETIPIIKKKADWAMRWIENKTADLMTRLIAFACVEGIFFSSSFCSIFWLKKRGLLPGLTFSNELISRDESLHTEFAILLYHTLRDKRTDYNVIIMDMVREAVELEKEFAKDSLQMNLIGMNADLMCQYIEFVGDRLLLQLGLDKHWKTANPFDFMELISMNSKTNFFESRVSQYSRAGISNSLNQKDTTEANTDAIVYSEDF
jgi:ribonucleoside-diphosphate reductase subunit M2